MFILYYFINIFYIIDFWSHLSVNTVSAPPVNAVKVTHTPTYQYTNPVFKHAIVKKPGFSNSHVITSPALAVVTLNSSLHL